MIEWKRIEGGFDGFERLAVDFVNDVEPVAGGSSWKRTPRTRDGNRDACTIVFGYRPEGLTQTEWWMEAKYSTTLTRMPRYRLDATIVSAFINGNVGRVVFVTNVDVQAKTICDIQAALVGSGLCASVSFYARNHLEYWLLSDYPRYCKYFRNLAKAEFDAVPRPPLWFGTTSLDVYPAFGTFREPVDVLYQGERYLVQVEATSDASQSLVMTLETPALSFGRPGKRRKKTLRLDISPGVSSITLPITLAVSSKDTDGALVISCSNGTTLTSSRLRFIRARQLDIESQRHIEEVGNSLWKSGRTSRRPSLLVVTGESGTGKTHVLHAIENESYQPRDLFQEVCFTDDESQNLSKLAGLILAFFFPYVDPADLDEEYLSAVNFPRSQATLLLDLAAAHKTGRGITEGLLSGREFFRRLIPEARQPVTRFIVCDDVQRLSPQLQEALFGFVGELGERGYPVFVMLAGQRSHSWHGLMSLMTRVPTTETACSVSTRDVEKQVARTGVPFDHATIDALFGSVIEFEYFLRFLSETTSPAPRTLTDFMVAYRLFQNADILKEYVCRKFRELLPPQGNGRITTTHDWDVLSFIYYCPEAFPPSEYVRYQSELDRLFAHGLIRINANNEVVPFHDLYSAIYRDNFEISVPAGLSLANPSALVEAMVRLGSSRGSSPELLDYLDELFGLQRFHTLFYLLDPYLGDERLRRDLEIRLPRETYLTLCFLYAYANANVGQRVSGLEYFERVRERIGVPRGADMTALHYLTVFETFNSSFEHMLYDRARGYWWELRQDERRLLSYKDTDYRFKELAGQRRLSAESIKLMLDAEQGGDAWEGLCSYGDLLIREGRLSDYAFDLYRAAATQIIGHEEDVLRVIGLCRRKCPPENRKGLLRISFAEEFYCCVKDDTRDITRLQGLQEDIKEDYYNDYNRHLPPMAVLYLLRHDAEAAIAELVEYQSTRRKRAERQDAIYGVALAITSTIAGDAKGLGDPVKLLEAARKTFSPCPSYLPVLDHDLRQCEHPHCATTASLYYGQALEEGVLYFDARFIN